jgi:hypothetical protein
LHAPPIRNRRAILLEALSRCSPGQQQPDGPTVRFRDNYFPEEIGPDPFPVGDWIVDPTKANCFYSFEKCDGLHNVPFDDVKTAW